MGSLGLVGFDLLHGWTVGPQIGSSKRLNNVGDTLWVWDDVVSSTLLGKRWLGLLYSLSSRGKSFCNSWRAAVNFSLPLNSLSTDRKKSYLDFYTSTLIITRSICFLVRLHCHRVHQFSARRWLKLRIIPG